MDSVLSNEYIVTKDKIFVTKKFIKVTRRKLSLKKKGCNNRHKLLCRLFGYGDVIQLTGGMIDLWTISRRAIKQS